MGSGAARVSASASTGVPVAQAAYGPANASPAGGSGNPFSLSHPFGLYSWVGVGSIVGLVLIWHSLPK
jgi:hypothetical protein